MILCFEQMDLPKNSTFIFITDAILEVIYVLFFLKKGHNVKYNLKFWSKPLVL